MRQRLWGKRTDAILTAVHRQLAPAEGLRVPERFNFTRDVVEQLAQADGTRLAVAFVDEIGVIERRTFAQVAANASRWAALLRSRGLEPGARVLVHLGQAPEWYDVLLGAFKAGVIVVPSRPASLAPDLAFFGGHSGVELVVTRRRYAAELARMDVPVEVLFVEDVTPELAVAPVTHPTHETTFDDIAFVAYTHRESGDPLGVVHSHGHTYSSGQDAHHWLGARPGDLVWCSARLGSARSLWSFLGAFSNGSGVVVHDGTFDPEQTLGFIQRLDVTVLCLTPAEYEALAATPDLHQSQLSVGHAVSTGGELDREVIEAFHAASGLIVHDAYGQSETGVVVANSPASLVDPGSIGMALPGLDVSVVDAGGN